MTPNAATATYWEPPTTTSLPQLRSLSTKPLRASSTTAQLASFTLIGALSNVAYLSLFAIGTWVTSQHLTNLVAMALSTILSNTANRRLTFGVHGKQDALRHQIGGVAIFLLALALTSGSLLALETLAPTATATTQTEVLVAANLVAGALRFVALRTLMQP